MPEEHKTIKARLSASPEVYHMARFEKAFPWLLAGGAALVLLETCRKNTNDRAKANADFKAALKNQEHQAEVLKERKAERREPPFVWVVCTRSLDSWMSGLKKRT